MLRPHQVSKRSHTALQDPIQQFNQWWQAAVKDSPLRQKSAVCISTINKDGFPSGRYVDLKAVDKEGFVFCTYLDSDKGRDIVNNPKVALTAWWDHMGYQVRVTGQANAIDDVKAQSYWQTRGRDAQLTTHAFAQSRPLDSQADLKSRFEAISEAFRDKGVEKPQNWGGYCIAPQTIEFLTFQENRLHLREKYLRLAQGWQLQLLQP
ncbi:pyridoxamine 5'-phosphate oxidase [Aliiglaciecola sp. CAU 1673]|uniref:pyridoxamine 5'-phosphate oxidase n=1 Tax=Aliiglaciecola sp. CAU 1673 TaxID=3032595 RepID=UPI0023DC91F1|nr:pyridoxamine 5'-phosphate oxidase [Aliiglaciecola sp. CAU 1673]MDF2176915.1 pyridoxamine 5'-phosphate oxidase [Aliiglaciecola sp. CAU 1673]